MATTRPRKVLIVGAGPVGALTALSLHRRGWDVELWESREDPRGQTTAMTNLRSINLAISARGLEALRSVDPSLAEQFLAEAIPMKGRMIHHVNGKQESQIYDPIHGQCINSISRPILNQRLLEALPKQIKIRFTTKLSRIDLKRKRAYGISAESHTSVPGQEEQDTKVGDKNKRSRDTVEDEEPTLFDLVVGCDGSWSKVRAEMMRVERVDFSQSFITHAYIELHMPRDPSRTGGFAIDKNHLHIWPRTTFMLIALPNKDGSFTITLFAPNSSIDKIDTYDAAARFFREEFPSAVQFAGEERLVKDFLANPRGSLVTINVSPTYWSSHAILLGDASHSMVPFYGQGLNCGLEDVRVFNACLERHNISSTTDAALGGFDKQLEDALREYSESRKEDLEAICKLAMDNYDEMKAHVLSPLHLLRRSLDTFLEKLFRSSSASSLSLTEAFPTKRVSGWTSLYEMVTFRPDVGYAEARRREQWQKNIVGWGVWVTGACGIGALGVAGVYAGRFMSRRR